MIYPWHQELWDSVIKKIDYIPNNCLFIGQKGIGKTQFVRNLASYLLYSNNQEVKERPNYLDAKLDDFEHPDFYQITNLNDEGTSNTIKIEQIREIIPKLQLTSLKGGLKIVIINPVEKLNIQAGNALLKILEEPPANTIFLLISNKIEKVLPTIISRCQKFIFPIPDYQLSLNYLLENNVPNSQNLLSFNSNSPIFEFDELQNNIRKRLVDFLLAPKINEILELSELINKNKININLNLFINWMLKWVTDMISLSMGANIRFYLEYDEKIYKIKDKYSVLKLFKFYEKLKIINTYNYNLNLKLQIEKILIEYLLITLSK